MYDDIQICSTSTIVTVVLYPIRNTQERNVKCSLLEGYKHTLNLSFFRRCICFNQPNALADRLTCSHGLRQFAVHIGVLSQE